MLGTEDVDRRVHLANRELLRSRVGCFHDRRERSIQRLDEQVGIGPIERHRRTDLHDVVIWTIRAEEDAHLPEAVRYVRRLRSGRFERLAVAHQLDAEEETGPTHVAHELVRPGLG